MLEISSTTFGSTSTTSIHNTSVGWLASTRPFLTTLRSYLWASLLKGTTFYAFIFSEALAEGLNRQSSFMYVSVPMNACLRRQNLTVLLIIIGYGPCSRMDHHKGALDERPGGSKRFGRDILILPRWLNIQHLLYCRNIQETIKSARWSTSTTSTCFLLRTRMVCSTVSVIPRTPT